MSGQDHGASLSATGLSSSTAPEVAALRASIPSAMSFSDSLRCTCRFGRDHDGSEFGPCAYCEAQDDEEKEQMA